MRPRLITAENDQAAAADIDRAAAASMRPRLITAENGGRRHAHHQDHGASMRPRLITAENADVRPRRAVEDALQ